MNTKFRLLTLICLLSGSSLSAQLGPITKPFTHADTLRGTITPERAWWDVLHYTILVTPDFEAKKIAGKVDIKFKVLYPGKRMQIDLQQPLCWKKLLSAMQNVPYKREGNVYYIDVPKTSQERICLYPGPSV
jgi:hypothetical protein